MKQKDVILIIVIAFISAVLSLVLSNILFASPKSRKQTIEVVDPITSDFSMPSKKYFNNSSIDPTQLIQIGNNNNQTPFNGQSSQ
ncbi:MAG TPA: hypothetical protein VJR27_04510 [Candidatus Saccharimonadales bacterium]|nr:hypothetical protein [Candidatus Saccharimonadales bacterium]